MQKHEWISQYYTTLSRCSVWNLVYSNTDQRGGCDHTKAFLDAAPPENQYREVDKMHLPASPWRGLSAWFSGSCLRISLWPCLHLGADRQMSRISGTADLMRKPMSVDSSWETFVPNSPFRESLQELTWSWITSLWAAVSLEWEGAVWTNIQALAIEPLPGSVHTECCQLHTGEWRNWDAHLTPGLPLVRLTFLFF